MRRLLFLALLVTIVLASLPASGTVGKSRGQKASLRDRVTDVRQEMSSLLEEVDDLREPVDEFEIFDQCMYVIGVTEYGDDSGNSGYVFGANGEPRPAFAMDIRGFGTPQYQLLAYPGEEPPSIECNEDASGRPENSQ
jgi:hypothetical protein